MRAELQRHRFAYVWVFACILAAAVIFFANSGPPLMGDYAEWTYHGVLFRDILRGGTLNHVYVLKPYPVPNSITTLGLGILMLVLPWKIAAKLWLLAVACVGLLSVMRIRQAVPDAQDWTLFIVVPGVLFSSVFWFGFINFEIGVFFAIFIAARLLQGKDSSLPLAVLLLLAFFSHMVPFAFSMLLLCTYAYDTKKFRLLLSSLPSLALTAGYFIGRALHGNADAKAGMSASVAYLRPAFFAFKVNSYLKCWGFSNPALTERDSILLRLVGTGLFVFLVVCCLIVAAMGAWAIAACVRNSLKTASPHRFFWVSVSIFVVVALVMPGAAAGLSDPGGRMMQTAIWPAISLLTVRSQRLAALLSFCAITLALADEYLLDKVAVKPPMAGVETGPLPAHLREFAHVYYANCAYYYTAIDSGRRDMPIYPTAMFLPTDDALMR